MLFGSSFLYLLHLWNLSAHEDRYGAVVHGVHHVVKQLNRLQLEDEQRVFLLVRGVLYRVFQLVELAEVLLPSLVDDVQQNLLLELLDNRLTLSVVSLLEVTGNVVHLTAIGQGHNDALIHLTLVLIDLFDDGHGDLLDVFHFALEVTHHYLEDLLAEFLVVLVDELVAGEGTLHGKQFDELLLATLVVVGLNDVNHTVPDGVGDVHADTLTHEGVATLAIDDGTLFVHHVVVLQQTLTDAEVVLFHFLLGALYLLGNHRTLQHLALLEAQLVHHGGNSFRTEQTHQLVFQRDEEQ